MPTMILEDGTLNTDLLKTIYNSSAELEIIDQYEIGIITENECLGQLRAKNMA